MEALAILPFLIFIFFGIIGLVGLAFWIWAIVDCATNEPSTGNDKVIWILIIVLTSWLGALLYLCIRRPQRMREFGR